jgi:hypothetical protein
MTSVFAKYQRKNYPHTFVGSIHLHTIAGGVPLNEKTLEGHLKRKTAAPDDLIRAEVATLMAETGLDADEAIAQAAKLKGLVGFAKDDHGCYVRGFQVKAMLVEAACIAASEDRIAKKWGNMSEAGKALRSWFPEHVFVLDDRIYLGRDEADEIPQSFIHKMGPKGPMSAIQYTEIIRDASASFTVETDHDFPPDVWAAIWLTGERSGLGASRKLGYGTFEVRQWEPISGTASNGRKRTSRKDLAAV